MALRIVQLGSGSKRPVVIVYHLTGELDGEIKTAVGPNAVIANDTREPFKGLYGQVPPLKDTLATLQGKVGPDVTLGPVIVAGFSEGGNVTQRVLTLGGDPDAIVIADGSHSSLPLVPQGYDRWKAYSDRAKTGTRVFIGSHSSLVYVETLPTPYASTWRVLKAITGYDLPLGTGANVLGRPKGTPAIVGPGPVKHEQGNSIVYSYPGADQAAHVYQAKYVIGMMLAQAMDRLGQSRCGTPASTSTGAAASCAYYPEHSIAPTVDAPSGLAGSKNAAVPIGLALAIGLGLVLVNRK